MQVLGIDTGGTFTDAAVVLADGRVAVGKALSTPPKFEDGVLDSLTATAEDAGISRAKLLADTRVIAHGTTVGLNGLLTRTGAGVGLLVTAGFESTLPLAKANKLYGRPADFTTDALRWDKPQLLVPRHRIRGVSERIDVRGEVVVELDEAQAAEAIDILLDSGVEALGISLLWSPVNPRHERRLRELVHARAPDLPVTLSSELCPRIGEYERTASVAVNAYVAPLVGGYLERLVDRLCDEGFAGDLLVTTMGGGVIAPDAAVRAPIHTLQSGPAAGLAGAKRLAATAGHGDVITTDVGGTSFDVGLVLDGSLPLARRPMIERQALAVPVVDVTSIGTGGGSIAWYDHVLGTLRVGPRSAGSSPGPACYGRGGSLPTVTDAAVVLGYVDRLGSHLELDRDAAERALVEHVAVPLGVAAVAAAEGVLDVAVAQMADLVRRTTVRRGHDPGNFALYGFGGAAPQYLGRYATELGVREVVIPNLAAEFSAAGAATSELRAAVRRDVGAGELVDSAAWLPGVLDELTALAERDLGGEVSGLERVGATKRVERRLGLRFYRQLNAIDVALHGTAVGGAQLESAADEFRTRYEQITGAGTSAVGAPIELVSVEVEVAVTLPAATPLALPITADPAVPQRTRVAWFDCNRAETPVYAWSDLHAGEVIAGPAFIESEQTTVVVYPRQAARSDELGNLTLEVVER